MPDPINVDALTALPEKDFSFGVDEITLAGQLEALAAGLRDGSILKRDVSQTTRAGNDDFTYKSVTIGYFVRA